MKTIKKAFMFCLILVCCSYFVIKAKTNLDLRVQGATASSSSEADLENNAISNEYRKYVAAKKEYHKETYGNEDYFPQGVKQEISKGVVVQTEVDVDYTFQVSVSGFYNIYIDYTILDGYKSSMERMLLINGEVPFSGADTLTFSRVWADDLAKDKEFQTDTNGNQRKPQQVEKSKLTNEPTKSSSYVKDYMGYETAPYKFYFEQGVDYIVTLRVSKEPMQLDKVTLLSVVDTPNYSDY